MEKFRKARADDLRQTARTLDSIFGAKKGQYQINTTPIFTAAKNLEKGIYCDKAMEGTFWGYEINNFKLPVETLRHIRPIGIKGVELTLNMKLEADSDSWDTLKDPLINLNFNVVLKAISDKNSYFCFHIDKHDMAKFSTEPHPIYHIQYSPKPKDAEEFDYGNVLSIDTPRIMHQPLDFNLGIGFLISNFSPSKWEALIKDRFFKKVYSKYQISILKPYNHSYANHWTPFNSEDISWNPTNHFCPFVI